MNVIFVRELSYPLRPEGYRQQQSSGEPAAVSHSAWAQTGREQGGRPFTYLQSEELHASHQGPPEERSSLPSLATSLVLENRILPARHGLGLFLWILLPLLSYKHLKTKQNKTIIPTTQSCYLLPSIILETVPFFFCMSVYIRGRMILMLHLLPA